MPKKTGQCWVDRGGTFTDLIAWKPNSELIIHKLLSANPQQYADPIVYGIQQLGCDLAELARIQLGTTLATNALLERKGAKTLLLITQGFADALQIGYQYRPDLFALNIELPSVLYERVVEISERIDADGHVLQPLDLSLLKQPLTDAKKAGIESVAIVCLHAYRFPQHEQAVADYVKEFGFQQISVSHQISPLQKLVRRGDTSMVDAYLAPLMRSYLRDLQQQFSTAHVAVMQSSGGLCQADLVHAKDCILSGPAAGVVGAVAVSQAAGFPHIISFDMGGTSTDVAHFNGDYEQSYTTEIGGVRLSVPMLRIHTIAAGGGSQIKFSQGRLHVGPESAGAQPGPVCYRQHGPLTLTDCHVFLGRIYPDFFPHVFGEKQNQSLDSVAVAEALNTLSADIKATESQDLTASQIAAGCLDIAVLNMANAIKKISLQRGYDVQDYALCCFGGAGGQTACLVAEALGIDHILIHPCAGLLSALGMGLATYTASKEQTIEADLDKAGLVQVNTDYQQLMQAAAEVLRQQGFAESDWQVTQTIYLKYAGTDVALPCQYENNFKQLEKDFNQLHEQTYGFQFSDKVIKIDMISLTLTTEPKVVLGDLDFAPSATSAAKAVGETRLWSAGDWHDAPVYQRNELPADTTLTGPALICEANGTNVIEVGWQAHIRADGNLILTRIATDAVALTDVAKVDPIRLEIFNNLFMSIAEEMGQVLLNTAYSVNIKERHDFSCALFDANGELIANAPHIPVHLGSMSESVVSIIQQRGDTMQRGDVYALNDPYHGGTHLPDVTVITPVFLDEKKPFCFVASRGHHADLGGITPGSIPPDSTSIDQEGILLNNMSLVKQGVFQTDAINAALLAPPYPVRNLKQNVADLKAQIAANQRGIYALEKLIQHVGKESVIAYMQHVKDNATYAVKTVLARLDDAEAQLSMDNGSVIRVQIRVDKQQRTAVIDFTGTSPQQTNNFNAPTAVCKAAVLYVLRSLVAEKIPLNAGCLVPIEIILPEHNLLNPQPPAAVVAGNVETSQHIVDVLFTAMDVMANAQGTMNNFTFGNADYQYYETVCGGSGAGEGFVGASAVQTHMTNSHLTDAEVLESRYPVYVREFSIRRGSGGQGRWHGGDGVKRVIEFREPMTVTILSQRRQVAPAGLHGGGAGAVGENYVVRVDGKREKLAACVKVDVNVGDCIEILTPGGGAWGSL